MLNDTRYRGARLLYFSISPRYSNVYLAQSRCSVNIMKIVCHASYAKNTQSNSPLTLSRLSLAPLPLKKAVVGKMTTFDLWPRPFGWGAWGAGTNIWHPETPASYESLPAPLATQIPALWIHTSGGRGRGGPLILDRCRAFDLFASVDAHLCKKALFQPPPPPPGPSAYTEFHFHSSWYSAKSKTTRSETLLAEKGFHGCSSVESNRQTWTSFLHRAKKVLPCQAPKVRPTYY